MVHKIRLIILFFVIFILCFTGLKHKGYVETNLLKTLLPQKVIDSTEIVPIANKSASVIKVVFEADNDLELDNLRKKFIKQTDTEYFEISNFDFSKLLEKYISQPTNFLSNKTRQLLFEKKYDKVYNNSIQMLYNPAGIQFTTLDKDPYLLFDDFLISNKKVSDKTDYMDGKYYDYLSLKIKNNDTFSPDIVNKKISEIVNLQKNLSDKNSKIYLAGTPVHSYYASSRSVKDINIICILSILMIIFLTYKYFRNLKLLLPIALSISFGLLLGFVATRLWFDSFQIITMVFSTTLIGIGIDYSYHYFFADKIDKNFIKNLSFSFLTTVVPFILLYLTGIELLKQVAVFTVFGLLGIYLAVLYVYPSFKFPTSHKTIVPNRNICKIFLLILCILSFAGLFRFCFNDTLASLYSPSKSLKKAEGLYNKVSGENIKNTKFITIKGENPEDIIEKEEKISEKLAKENIDYMALSRFMPSTKYQQENYNLVKGLYNANLDKYSNILSNTQINLLKNSSFTPVIFNIEDYPYLQNFILNSDTSIIYIFDEKNINITEPYAQKTDFKSDAEGYIKDYRTILLYLFPIVIFLLITMLKYLYDLKKAVIIITPSVVGVVVSLLITSLLYGEINLFGIITMYLILGFTMDYSIFRAGEDDAESAIFVSCLTTTFSFLLLMFCGFKLLSSMAAVLFFGILTSYLVGYLLFFKHCDRNAEKTEWFEVKEQSAGEKRLILSWVLYKIFGKNILYFIAFCVAFFTFLFAPNIRRFSKKYFKVIESCTGLKPNLINVFRHIHSYAISLADKIILYSGDFRLDNIIFDNEDDEILLNNDIKQNDGVFFICNHIGNIEIMQAIPIYNEEFKNSNIDIFMSNRQSQIFNNFLKKIKIDFPVKLFSTEAIGLTTGVELKENLNKGDIVFIAGDRLAENNSQKCISSELFSNKILLPKGTFKLAKLMAVPTYFVSAVKIGKQYKIILEKQNNLNEEELAASFSKFMERTIKIAPLQFFHFYDFFD